MKCRNYVLTLWSHLLPEGRWEWVLETYVEHGVLRFAAYGVETCPSTQREHLQTYVCFPHPVSHKRVCHLFPESYVAQMEGTLSQNETYCSKQAELVKLGDEPNEQGKRNDLVRARDYIEETGERPMKIARTSQDAKLVSSVIRHYRFFQEQYSEVSWEKRCAEGFKPPKVIIYTGDPGSGKSKRVWDDVGYANAGVQMWQSWCSTGEYFNGYHGQPIAFFEDVQKGKGLPDLPTFKRILDGHPVRVNIKFGEPVVFQPEVIYITSNSVWRSWYDFPGPSDTEAVERRITKWVQVYKHLPDCVEIDKTRDGLQEQVAPQLGQESRDEERQGQLGEEDPDQGEEAELCESGSASGEEDL